MAKRFSVQAVFEGIDKITLPVEKIETRIGKFSQSIQKNMRTTLRTTNRLSKSILGVGKALFKFGAVATIAAVGATTLALTKAANSADELAKRSNRLKFPIEELQKWQFEA